MRVLIAEDTASSRTVLKKILTYWGFDIYIAKDGTEAMRFLNEFDRPDIALLDWEMPGKTGIELCKIIRESASLRSVYVIILTANDKDEYMLKGFESGVDDFLTKPVTADALEASMNRGKLIVNQKIPFDERGAQRSENVKRFLDREKTESTVKKED